MQLHVKDEIIWSKRLIDPNKTTEITNSEIFILLLFVEENTLEKQFHLRKNNKIHLLKQLEKDIIYEHWKWEFIKVQIQLTIYELLVDPIDLSEDRDPG